MVYVWLAVIIVAVVAEALTTQLVSIWFAAGGVMGLILSAAGVDPWVQVLVAALVTLICLLATRPFVKKKLSFQKVSTNADRYVGQTGIVVEDIDNRAEKGQVKVLGSVWTARSALGDDIIAKGTEVHVNRLEGVRLFVEPQNRMEEE